MRDVALEILLRFLALGRRAQGDHPADTRIQALRDALDGTAFASCMPGRPGEFRPEPPTDPDVNLSIHPARATLEKAAAFHQDKEFLRLSVDSILTWVACRLRSTGITPLPRYYAAVRPWPVHRYFRPHGSSTCAFSLGITGPVLKFHTKARIRVTPPMHRNTAWPVSR
jgi:hypothetical protein